MVGLDVLILGQDVLRKGACVSIERREGQSIQISIKVAAELLAEIDHYIADRSKNMPGGHPMTRSHAVRSLVLQGLEVWKKDAKARGSRGS